METLSARRIDSPFGTLVLLASRTGLVGVGWPGRAPDEGEAAASHDVLDAAAAQLAEYFAGRRMIFDIPLDMRGTPFQRRVWRLLTEIPYGETSSYGALARRLEQPGAARAVGAANARNPLAIIVPCHRVIASGGGLSGFAGGVAMKRGLLDLERAGVSVEMPRRSS